MRKNDENSIRTAQSQIISRYRSLKTLPSRSNVYGEPPNRRMLVNPPTCSSSNRRESNDRKVIKYDCKKI